MFGKRGRQFQITDSTRVQISQSQHKTKSGYESFCCKTYYIYLYLYIFHFTYYSAFHREKTLKGKRSIKKRKVQSSTSVVHASCSNFLLSSVTTNHHYNHPNIYMEGVVGENNRLQQPAGLFLSQLLSPITVNKCAKTDSFIEHSHLRLPDCIV